MRKILGILIIWNFALVAQAQDLELFKPGTKWILATEKIEKKELRFEPFKEEKVDLNTMIWTFLPGGFIEYDYQSSEDVFACAGVDFLDLDITECRWEFNPADMSVTLLLKGGYASIDDFVFKRRYLVSIDDSDYNYAYILKKENEYFFNDLSKK